MRETCDVDELQSKIGYIFINKELLNRALTRKALKPDEVGDTQEAYSTLGDGLLRAILVERLINIYPSKGEITIKKSELEQNSTLFKIGSKWPLEECIDTTTGEKEDAGGKEKRIADTVEAIIAAIYLDGGFEITKKVVLQWYSNFPM